MVESLSKLWENPPAFYRGAPFWSWNAKLDPARLCRQIEDMAEAGLGGFFMHSRYGLKTEYFSDEWFDCIRECVNKASQLDLKAYLYDEDRWPSGSAGGIITRNDTVYCLRYLAAVDPNIQQVPNLEQRLGLFAVKFNEKHQIIEYRSVALQEPEKDETLLAFDVRFQEKRAWENDGTYIDTMNHDAVSAFLRVTHEEYTRRLGQFYDNTIPAIFTDEPNYGYWATGYKDGAYRVPWTVRLLDIFSERCGYDILKFLPEIVFPLQGNEFSSARYDYYRVISELFVENFSKQIGRWCSKNNVKLTGHMLLEGTLTTQTTAVGNCMPHYEYFQWPGIDILADQTNELETVKQCTSVADQLGKERILSEMYGCTGWDWPLEGHKFHGDWQYVNGINFRCQHLTHYSLAGGAKRDYPASFAHTPWWKYYRVVEDYFGRLSLMLTQGKAIRDILVIHPIETAWGLFSHVNKESDNPLITFENNLHKIIYALQGEHYDWDFADESLLAKYGFVSEQNIQVGQMSYKVVIVPSIRSLRSTTVELLQEFIANGGKLIFIGDPPVLIDGRTDIKLKLLFNTGMASTTDNNGFIKDIEAFLPRRVRITEDGNEQQCVWAMLRKLEGGNLLFIQSHDRKLSHKVHIHVKDLELPLIQWDAASGKKTMIMATHIDNTLAWDTELSPTGSALFTFGIAVPDVEILHDQLIVKQTVQIAGPFEIELSEPNTMPLDYCSYKFADDPWSEKMPTLKVDQIIRAKFGLEPRIGHEQQPWYLYSKGVVDTQPRGRLQLKYKFHITDLPLCCALAIENPHAFTISVNGRKINNISGFWIDEDIQTLDIHQCLHVGQNEISMDTNYRPDMELEDCYLVGKFGVTAFNPLPPCPENMTIIREPKKLSFGSWVGQGLDFYTGAVKYKLEVSKPATNNRVQIKLPSVKCTMVIIHVNGKRFILPWQPFCADITDALIHEKQTILIEIFGGRKNSLGPLHVPDDTWTGPKHFDPSNPNWKYEYQLNNHGIYDSVIIESRI